MGKIYIGQTDLIIKVNTGQNLDDFSSGKLVVKNPNGQTDDLNVTISNSNIGEVQHVLSNPFSIPGTYTGWVEIINNLGLKSIGEPFSFIIYNVGT